MNSRKKRIYDFAVTWRNKFKDMNIDYLELADHYMGDDFEAQGFKMDDGESFSNLYGAAVYDHEELRKIIDDVNDIDVLASAIYSRWHYFNHWANSGKEIIAPENRDWFNVALSRLVQLTRVHRHTVEGEFKSIDIVSRMLTENVRFRPSQEIRQSISVDQGGRVEFWAYNYGDDGLGTDVSRSEVFEIDPQTARSIFDAVSNYCNEDYYSDSFSTEGGVWDVVLVNTEGSTFKFRGSLGRGIENKRMAMSDFVRKALGLEGLMLFDGNNKPDSHKEEFIFCSINFGDGFMNYYYLTDDRTIRVGDCVVVPGGMEDNLVNANVVKIERFTKENAPMRIDKMKWVVRKCTEEDLKDD